MGEHTTVERRTTVVPEPAIEGTTNVNIDANTGATTVQHEEPVTRETTVRETTVERTTRT